MDNQPLVVERVFNAPVSRVWEAITNNEQMKKWYFSISAFKAEPGFEFSFSAKTEDNLEYIHRCQVIEVIAGKKLAYTWSYDGYPGKSELMWELKDEAGKTRLILTHKGLETFSANGKDFQKSSFEGGWNYILDKSLAVYLDGGEPPKI